MGLLVLATLLAGCAGDGASTAARPSVPPDELRISFVGDSVMFQVADAARFALDATGAATTRYSLLISLDEGQGEFWARAHQAFAADVIVVLLGTWEDIRMFDEGDAVPNARWAKRYGRSVREHLHRMTADGARVIWIGMPVAPPEFGLNFERLNGVYRREVERLDGGVYLDGTTILASAPHGESGFTGTDAGPSVPLRGIDGHHLCQPAVRLIMDAVLDNLVATGEIEALPEWASRYRWRPETFPFDEHENLQCRRAFTQADADLAATGIFRPQPAGP